MNNYKDLVNSRFIEICDILISLKKVSNKTELAKILGIKTNKLSEILNNRMRAGVSEIQILCSSFNVSFDYLFNGFGNIFIDDVVLNKKGSNNTFIKEIKNNISAEDVHPSGNINMSTQQIGMSTQDVRSTEKDEVYFDNSIQLVSPTLKPFSTISEKRLERQQVPLYDIDASAGIRPILEGASTPVDYISIPNLPKCDGAVNVRGDSMYPLLKSGDIVLFRNINSFDYIIWGEMYLISFCHDEEEFCVIKYVQKSEKLDKIMLVSYNKNYSSLEIYRDEIRVLAIIQATVRYNTMT